MDHRLGAEVRGVIRIALAVAASAVLAGAQTPLDSAATARRLRLLGVFDVETGQPIEGAAVTDAFSRTTATTTRTGTVNLAFLPEGGSMLRIQKIGFEPAIQMVVMSPSDTVPITVLLRPNPATLPTVVTRDAAPRFISPSLSAFEERRRNGHGKFIASAELRRNDNRSMTNVVRSLGLNVKCDKKAPVHCLAVSSRQPSKYGILGQLCAFDVYLDGVPMSDDDRDLEQLRVDQFDAVEAYEGPATVPAEFNRTGSVCGVILFWTRER